MTKPSNNKLISFLQSNKKFIIFILLMSVFRSAVADWYTVPTGSMQPTIQEGDRIVVNKMAYDLRLPFTGVTLVSLDTPQRGEIVVFESKAADLRLIKRVIGLPGDVVAMNNEIIQVNGKTLSYKALAKSPNNQNSTTISSIETIGDIHHHINIDNTASDSLSNFSPVTVPAGHYLVLGDNRRHSADSRVYGFVPHNELRGKATAIAFSVNYDNYYIPRSDRFLQDIYRL
ncbi:signal peptidase I [Colwellia sp. 75C3]|uniref:signal peptidase I n=1 Tax=Colwellia sp. 75C3 TaxID=888425 RepID=UPI000C3309BA|nr:signal peptidase I [Colwellia sp. 75C3]PKG81273.1 signal peptidase I [Colwellia sp. 75C3]